MHQQQQKSASLAVNPLNQQLPHHQQPLPPRQQQLPPRQQQLPSHQQQLPAPQQQLPQHRAHFPIAPVLTSPTSGNALPQANVTSTSHQISPFVQSQPNAANNMEVSSFIVDVINFPLQISLFCYDLHLFFYLKRIFNLRLFYILCFAYLLILI